MSECTYRLFVAIMKRGVVFSLVVVLFLVPLLSVPASAQNPLPAVELTCGSDPSMDVRPTSDAEISVQCTVKNPTASSEDISITTLEWDGVLVEMALSEDSFSLGAGDEETFDITFTGQTKIPATTEYSFEIEAKVDTWNGVPWGQLPEQLATNDTHIGKLKIETYGMVELLLSDVTTRYMEPSDEVEFTFQVTNKGNDLDKLEVLFANSAELEAAGFSFPSGKMVSENVAYQGTSGVKTLSVRSPSEVTEDLRMPLVIRAQSDNDATAEFSEITIQLDIEAPSQSGGIDGLDSLSSDDSLLYISIGGGVILSVLFLVVLIRVLTKKKPKQNQLADIQQPIILPDEPEFEDDFGSDLDEMFSDLDDGPQESDEFDDLFDDL